MTVSLIIDTAVELEFTQPLQPKMTIHYAPPLAATELKGFLNKSDMACHFLLIVLVTVCASLCCDSSQNQAMSPT